MQALYQLEVVHAPIQQVLEFNWLNVPLEVEKHEYCVHLIQGVTENWEALDKVIESFSHKHITQLSSVIRCILRMSIFELMSAQLNAKIIIDDFLNLTRKYDGDESVAFVNGVLDSFEKERLAPTASDAQTDSAAPTND